MALRGTQTFKGKGEGAGRNLRSSYQRGRWKSKTKSQESQLENAELPDKGSDQCCGMLQTRWSAKMRTEKCIDVCVPLSICIYLHVHLASVCACCAHSRIC